ncbi:unnamed protein product [Candidula unifasciata]|uniref:G-protein coupled receptors family 1 profile domain-containing protein n=1 Tax=Candidula unifasciata TaxID=100452 RepID=A0A8S3YK39_9EUPU|nr:unnamed protein product [Candidula unifasciata]
MLSISSTEMLPFYDELPFQELIPRHISHTVYQVLRYALIPSISVVGIVGNVISIRILTRQGFRKCSNVLLVCLAFSDVLVLTGTNNFPVYIYNLNEPQVFMFSERINYLCYILAMIFLYITVTGLVASMLIPILITGERLLAIFCPLRVYFILTPCRIIILVIIIYILATLYFIYTFVICMQFRQTSIDGVSVGEIATTDLYVCDPRSQFTEVIDSIFNYSTGIIPISLVMIGCVVIGTQVVFITNRRKMLIASKVKLTRPIVSKTTKTLFSICVLFIVCSGFAFVFEFASKFQPVLQEFTMQTIFGCVQDFLVCINCVGNFIIYVGSNNNLRIIKGKTKLCNIRNICSSQEN